MKNIKWIRWAGIIILIGGFMRLFGHPQGNLVFTAGFAIFFLGKLLLWSEKWRGLYNRPFGREQRPLYLWHLLLILLALGAVFLRYYEYPYGNVLFVIALMAESMVNLRIRLNELVGSQNVSLGWRMLRHFLSRRRA
jgi:hypothetical protein